MTKPYDGKPATVGNGMMVALAAKNTDQVDALHAKALELGGADEGAPGPRGDSGFYAAYFRDLDGNKLSAFCMSETRIAPIQIHSRGAREDLPRHSAGKTRGSDTPRWR